MKMTGEELAKQFGELNWFDGYYSGSSHITFNLVSKQEYEVPTAKVKVPAWFDKWVKEQASGFVWPDENGHKINLIINLIDKGPKELDEVTGEDYLKLVDAILHGYEVEKEKRYRIPLPNLKTSDGYQQYLSRKSKRNGHWFASRRQSNLIQAFTKAEVEQVPEAYRQYAVGLKQMKIISLQSVGLGTANRELETGAFPEELFVKVGQPSPFIGFKKVVSIEYVQQGSVFVQGEPRFGNGAYHVKTTNNHVFMLPADQYIAEWAEDGDNK